MEQVLLWHLNYGPAGARCTLHPTLKMSELELPEVDEAVFTEDEEEYEEEEGEGVKN